MHRLHKRQTAMACVILAAGMPGCSKESESDTESKYTPRERSTLADAGAHDQASAQSATKPSDGPHAGPPPGHGQTGLPPGHPPIPGQAPAEGHPPIGNGGGQAPAPGNTPFTAPEGWVAAPPRFMTDAVYVLSGTNGDAGDADVAVSSLGTLVPFDRNLTRWCGQFEFPDGKTCEDVVEQTELEGTKYPTTVAKMAGTYLGMRAQGEPKTDYAMMVAEVRTPDRPWYVKLTGPEKTVNHHEEAFLAFVRTAGQEEGE